MNSESESKSKSKPRSKSFRYWLPVFIYAILIFISSSISTEPGAGPPLSDWVMHMIVYAAFGLLLLRASVVSGSSIFYPKTGALLRAAFFAVLIATAYGILDEIHQYYVPGRYMSLTDAVANTFGSLIAVSFVLILVRKQRPSFFAVSQ